MHIVSTNEAKPFQGCKSIFSAGLDLNELYKSDAERFRKFWTTFQDVLNKLYRSTYPTEAAINVIT